jgi:hypothetical protein
VPVHINPDQLSEGAAQILEFCEDELFRDAECFKINAESGPIASIWAVWDSDNDGVVTATEFHEAWLAMDLDGNGQTNTLEANAYFSRNKYLLCRPFYAHSVKRY